MISSRKLGPDKPILIANFVEARFLRRNGMSRRAARVEFTCMFFLCGIFDSFKISETPSAIPVLRDYRHEDVNMVPLEKPQDISRLK